MSCREVVERLTQTRHKARMVQRISLRDFDFVFEDLVGRDDELTAIALHALSGVLTDFLRAVVAEYKALDSLPSTLPKHPV